MTNAIVPRIDMDRIQWIDIAKGIGISCVVLGHVIVLIPQLSVLFNMIYLFHVPLFFFISGFLFKKESKQTYYIIKKSKQLILPYISVFLLLCPVLLYLEFGGFDKFLLVFRKFLWGGEQLNVILKGVFIPMWFLMSLFITQIIYNFLQNILTTRNIHIVVLALYILSILQTLYFKDNLLPLPFSLYTITLSIPIFHIGYLCKKENLLNKENYIVPIIGCIALLSPIFISNNWLGMMTSNAGIPFFTLISSIFVIITVIQFSKKISETIIGRVFSNLGKASLVILCFHFPIYLLFYYTFSITFNSSNIYWLVPCLEVVILLLSYVIYLIFDAFKLTRILFEGKSN